MSDTTETNAANGETITPPAETKKGPEHLLKVTPTTIDDQRPVESMTFGLNAPEEERAEVADRVRGLLQMCGVKTGNDIAALGCIRATEILGVDGAQFLRIGLAGCGVGLACHEPPSLFCLVHNTIGGLQPGQRANGDPATSGRMSRPLTAEEERQMRLTMKAANLGSQEGAHRALRGIDEDFVRGVFSQEEADADIDATDDAPREFPQAPPGPLPTSPLLAMDDDGGYDWRCPTHRKTDWGCRHCVAQAIVEGELTPTFALVDPTMDDGTTFKGNAGETVLELAERNAEGAEAADLYVRCAKFTRKLSRD